MFSTSKPLKSTLPPSYLPENNVESEDSLEYNPDTSLVININGRRILGHKQFRTQCQSADLILMSPKLQKREFR